MLKNWKKKVVAMFLIFTMTFSNFALVGKTYAASIIDGIFGGQEDTGDTGSANVEFDAYFKDADGNSVKSLSSDIKDQDLMIGISVKVKDSGYLKDAKISFGNGSKMNFVMDTVIQEEVVTEQEDVQEITVGEEIEVTEPEVQYVETDLVEANEELQMMDDSILYLVQMEAGSSANQEFPIRYDYSRYVEESKISKSNTIRFEGTYVTADATEIAVSKDVDLTMSWKDEREVRIDSDVTKYLGYAQEGISGLILQTQIDIDNYSDNATLPVRSSEVVVEVPVLDGNAPATINVVATSTNGIDGMNAEQVVFDESNWSYDANANTITISKDNASVEMSTQNENDILIDETLPVADMYYAESGKDSYLITYTYENVAIGEKDFSSNIKATYAMFGNYELTEEVNAEYSVSDQVGDIVTFTADTSTSSISKGYTYLNYNNNDNKYEIELDNKLIFNVSYKDIVESLYYADNGSVYVDKDGNTYDNNDVYYKLISVSKENILNMLGEEGIITVKDNNGNEYTISYNPEDDVQEYSISFDNTVRSLEIITSKPINDGNLNIVAKKAYTDVNYSKPEFESFDNITFNNVGKAKYTYVNDLIDTGNSSVVVKLDDTTTTAELEVGQNSLSTLAMNNNVEIKIELNNQTVESDAYGNSTFEVKLPDYVEEVEIGPEDVSLVYGNGMEISSVEGFEYDDNIFIRIKTTGEQDRLSAGIISNGTNIVLTPNIKVDLFAPATEGKFVLTYINDEATNYEEENADFGTAEATVTYSAPTGVVSVNSTSGYSDDGRTLTSVNQGKITDEVAIYSEAKTAQMELTVMNNAGNDISNVAILGRVPFEGVKDIITGEDLGTTLDIKMTSPILSADDNDGAFKVYYSTNGEATQDLYDSNNGWTDDIDDLGEVKSYLLVPVDDEYVMEDTSKVRFTYNYEIPENLPHNEEIYGTFATYYTNNTDIATVNEISVADIVGLETGEGPEFEFNTTANKSVVNEFEDIEITTSITNVGKTTARNIVVNIPLTQRLKIQDVKSDVENAKWEYDETTNNLTYMIDSLDVNDSITYTLTVQAGYEYNEDEGAAQVEIYSTLTATDLDIILQTEKQIIDINSAELKITIDSSNYDAIVFKESNIKMYVRLQNLTNSDVHNAVVTMKVPSEFSFKSAAVLGYENDDYRYPVEVSQGIFDEATRTITWKIDSIRSLETISMNTYLEVNDLPDNAILKDVDFMAMAKADGTATYASPTFTYSVGRPVLSITQTTSTTNTYVKEGERINYQFTITNEGTTKADTVKVQDHIPEGLVVKSISYESEGIVVKQDVSSKDLVSIGSSIAPGETLTVNITAAATSLNGAGEKSVTNIGTVTAKNVDEVYSNEITHIIESSGRTANAQGAVSTGKASSSNTETTALSKTYKITGTAWLDENENGAREDGEPVMKSIKATLVDSDNGIIKQNTYTNSKGEYTFTGVYNGNYIIIFDYDTVRYTVTGYQKENVLSNINSDVITTKIEQDGKLRNGAVTDVITVQDGSVSSIDIGLVNALKFDLSLDMGVTKVTVQNSNGTKSTSYDQAKLTKTEIRAKQMAGTEVFIEYTLTVRNDGEVTGYAKKIVDYIPEGMNFNSSLNTEWFTGNDGNLYNTSLANVEIAPGETKTFKLVLSRTMTDDNTGIISNTAEIAEDYNIYGVSDIDSNPANKAQNEDDFVRTDSYISVGTGGVFIYISVVITTVILVGLAAGIVVVRIKNKKMMEGGV